MCESYLRLEDIADREGIDSRRLRDWIEAGSLPRPAYLLPDATPMFPADLLAVARSAGGVEPLAQHFATRMELAARLVGSVASTREPDWQDYLSGEYGICLRQVTPETLVLKEALVDRIGRQLEEPRPDDPCWRSTLAFQVEGLDVLLRPFTPADRVRFGRPTSRERLVEGPRRRWSWLRWPGDNAPQSGPTARHASRAT